MAKNKNERGPRSTSSELERKFYAPYYLEHIKGFISKDAIEYIYLLRIFSYSEKNADAIIQATDLKSYKKLHEIGVLPPNFEDNENEIGYMSLVKSKGNQYYIVILYNDENLKDFNLSLKKVSKISYKFEIEKFTGRSLIYPV